MADRTSRRGRRWRAPWDLTPTPTVPWGDPPVFRERPAEVPVETAPETAPEKSAEESSGDVSSGEGSRSTQG